MTTAEVPSLTTPADRVIVIERTFDAPRDQVWRAWTEPELIAQWWGRGRKTVVQQMEVRKGGHWHFVVDGKSETQGFRGRYREVTPPSRFVWTLEWDGMPGYLTIDTVELVDLGDGRTKLINTSQFLTDEERDMSLKSGMMEGVRDAYQALDKLLTTL
ncbi:MAG TPA: SRPBCC domain-containing protein [Gemmatimonadales bacterium]|nr:SRPBCC domain-containing protein [Gemmatimonadales bacterium]